MRPNIARALICLAALLSGSWAGAATYTYDSANRLTSVTYDDGAKIEYTYDAPGNIGSVTRTAAAGASTTSASTSTTQASATTTTAATTSSTASTTTTTLPASSGSAITLDLVNGWNLVGYGTSGQVTVSSAFPDPAKVTTVWKWMPAASNWAFYTPMQGDGGAAYAASKGYEFLTVINGGEGFWVNAKGPFNVQVPGGAAISSASFAQLPKGWSLIAVGESPTAKQFNAALGFNLTTLWAWDASLSNWYFFAPSLDANGNLGSYINSKGYLDFGAKLLEPTAGFWVNRP